MQGKFLGQKYPVYHPVELQNPALNPLHGKCIAGFRGMNMMPDQQEQQEVSYYILAFLSDNPDAGDIFDGLVEWWLLDQKIKFETRNVSEAVAWLVSEGLIVKHEEPDSRIIYKVNRNKKQDIRRILNQVRASKSSPTSLNNT